MADVDISWIASTSEQEHGVSASTPEQALYCAVIHCAIDDILRYLKSGPRYNKEYRRDAVKAQLWIKSTCTETLSFEWTVGVVFGRYPDDFELKVMEGIRKGFLKPLP